MTLLVYMIKKRKWNLWPCLWPLRRHIFDWSEWSRNFLKPHLARFHCKRCQTIIKELPFDDIPEPYRSRIFDISQTIKNEVDEHNVFD